MRCNVTWLKRKGAYCMEHLYEPKSGLLTLNYEPNSKQIPGENPPRFTWMPPKPEENHYILQVSSEKDFSSSDMLVEKGIPYNLFTPSQPFKDGSYYWRYAIYDSERKERTSEWSKTRSFEITDIPYETPLPVREERYPESLDHPRLWLKGEEINQLREDIREDSSQYDWDEFYQKSVEPFIERPLIPEPEPYPNNNKVASLWRQMYMDCQIALNAVRHLSVAGIILEDKKLIEKGREWLLHLTSWDTEGTTSRDYNDEAAFRIAAGIAWGYDWLYHHLTEEDRKEVRRNLYRRTEQVAYHVMRRSKIHQVPYDSHAVRSLSSVLVPCCIALLEEDSAKEWLDYTIDYFSAIYTPWGGMDGGWAEGPHYWMTGMAYIIDALNLIKNFTGIDLYKRPFFQKTGDFPLYVYSPDTVRASFGDQANLGDRPGLKVGFNIRQFAGVTGNGLYQWYYERTLEWDTNADEKFYNSGWWDFRFDNLMYKHDYQEVHAQSPKDQIEQVKWFKDVGWVAMHAEMDKPEEHIQFLTKSSPYGSISHSHGDQNSFLLHAYGEPLAIQSGYYVAFNSTMNKHYRRLTESKNAILIDGHGQYAGADKILNKEASGEIEEVKEGEGYAYVKADATNAYKANVPYLQKYIRETYFVNNRYFVIIDNVDLEQEGAIQWLYHSLTEMRIKDQSFRIEGEKAGLYGSFVYSSSSDLTISQTDQFPESVDPSEIEGLPNQWHLSASTRKAKRHRLATLLVPYQQNYEKYVSYFIDDQDHGMNLYMTEGGKTFRIVIPKVYSY